MKLAREIAKELDELRTNIHARLPNPDCWPLAAADIIAAHLEPVRSRLLAYKVHTLWGDHDKAARVVVDALALLEDEG